MTFVQSSWIVIAVPESSLPYGGAISQTMSALESHIASSIKIPLTKSSSWQMIYLSQSQQYLRSLQSRRRRWTKPSPPFHMLPQLSMPSPGVGVVVEVVVGEEIAVDAVVVEAVRMVKVSQVNPPSLLQDQSTRAQSTPTYRLETGRGALCISAGAGGPFSVVSQPHVLGRMFMPPSLQTNETGTSSVLIKMTL